jgi:hypothetical protein
VQIRSSSFTGSFVMARPNNGSRMNREVHVRFWESPEVKVLRGHSTADLRAAKILEMLDAGRAPGPEIAYHRVWGSSGECRNKTSAAGSSRAMLMNGR